MELFHELNRELFNGRLKLIDRSCSWIRFFIPAMNMSLFHYIIIVNKDQDESVILHEMQHTLDRCYIRDGVCRFSILKTLKFYSLYLLPQLLSIFSLLFFINLYFLLFLIFLIPNPYLTYFRREYELRSYFWTYMFNKTPRIYNIVFNSWCYWKMDTKHSEEYYIEQFKSFRKNVLSGVEYKSSLLYRKYIKYIQR